MPDPHDAFLRTLRPNTHGPARTVGRNGRSAPRSKGPNRAAWSRLHDPAASPSQVQQALVELVSGSSLRRVLRDDCAWDLPPANLAEVLAAERPLHGSNCDSSLTLGSQAASPGYGAVLRAAPGAASLRELVLEEEAVALQAESAALRAQLQRVHDELEREKAASAQSVKNLKAMMVDAAITAAAATVRWTTTVEGDDGRSALTAPPTRRRSAGGGGGEFRVTVLIT